MLEPRCLLSVSYTQETVAQFDGTTGPSPNGPLVDQDGNLFGVTAIGGENGLGTVFEIPATGNGSIVTLANFQDSLISTGLGGLISDGAGNMYGVAQGPNGTVFELGAGGGFTPLASFSGQGIENDTNPAGPLALVGGNLYGVAADGGANDAGEVFEESGGSIIDLAPFPAMDQPQAGLVADTVGNLFGIVTAPVPIVFELSGGALTTDATFASVDTPFPRGTQRSAPIVEVNGNLFGVDDGGVFEVAAGTHSIVQLGNSTGLSGQPESNLIADSSGDLFGATTTGVFEWVAATKSFTTIATLPTSVNGVPNGIVMNSQGDLFVTDGGGGTAGDGAVYELIPNGSPTPPPTTSSLTPTLTSSTVPASVVGGAKIHGTVKVSLDNAGSTTETGYTVNIYAGTSSTLDTTADTLVTAVTKTPALKAGKKASLSIPITELPASLNGSYYLIAETVDSSSNIASAAGSSTVEVAPPFVTLTETLTTTLPAALVSDSAAKGSVILAITNSGNVPSKGVTPITVTASTTSGVVGTIIATVTPPKNLNILPGKTVKVMIPIKSIPSLPSDNYFLVAQTTDPFAGGVSTASSANTIDIAAGFIQLSGTLGPASLKTGDTLTITNNGNVPDTATALSGTLGFSLDAAGAVPAGSTLPGTVKTPKIAAGKSVKIHLTEWKSILSSLTSGVPYYLTVTFSDGNGGTVLAVSTTTFTL
jgi:uncharacterized repeat protein (TIGR03803 family)